MTRPARTVLVAAAKSVMHPRMTFGVTVRRSNAQLARSSLVSALFCPSEVFELDALSVPQALARPFNPRKETRVILKLVVKPLVFRGKADPSARTFTFRSSRRHSDRPLALVEACLLAGAFESTPRRFGTARCTLWFRRRRDSMARRPRDTDRQNSGLPLTIRRS